MDGAGFHPGRFQDEAFRWKPVFTRRQTGVYYSENSRLILDGNPPSTREIVETFVDNGSIDDTGRYLSRKLLLENFLKTSDIELFRQQPDPSIFKPMVLLDDRNDGSVTRTLPSGNCRPFRGPLTAYQLLSELLRKRLPIPTPGAPGPVEQPDVIAAERRLIYITDLDSHCSLALAATASRLQAAFLRDFMHRYLACHTFIGVQIYSPSPSGLSTFALEFHLPYFAWRQMPSKIQDKRRKGDGTQLRVAEEVIHLKTKTTLPPESPDVHDYIYEAQLSIMITGADDWLWTGYCFVDIYFKEGETHSEDVNYLCQPTTRWTGRLDPHSCGRYAADPPLWLPREYFLRALATRMEQVKQEWSNTVSRLLQGVEPFVYSFTREDTDTNSTGDLNITQQKGFKWTIRVLHQFANLLSRTIAAWETFKDGEIRHFYVPRGDDSKAVSWLAAIDKDVTELKDLRSSLLYQTDLFENMMTDLMSHARITEAVIAREQSKIIQALSFITILYPPILVAMIFSMQFMLPADLAPKEWIYTLVAIFTGTTILVFNLSHLTTFIRPSRLGLEQLWPWIRSPRLRRASEAVNNIEHETDE